MLLFLESLTDDFQRAVFDLAQAAFQVLADFFFAVSGQTVEINYLPEQGVFQAYEVVGSFVKVRGIGEFPYQRPAGNFLLAEVLHSFSITGVYEAGVIKIIRDEGVLSFSIGDQFEVTNHPGAVVNVANHVLKEGDGFGVGYIIDRHIIAVVAAFGADAVFHFINIFDEYGVAGGRATIGGVYVSDGQELGAEAGLGANGAVELVDELLAQEGVLAGLVVGTVRHQFEVVVGVEASGAKASFFKLQLERRHRTIGTAEPSANRYLKIKNFTILNNLGGHEIHLLTVGFEGIKIYVKLNVGVVVVRHPVVKKAATYFLRAGSKNSAADEKAVKRSEEEAFHDFLYLWVW